MEPLQRLDAVACALPQINVDTDQVLPARYMKESRAAPGGYSPFLFHDLRRDAHGDLDPSFPLNRAANAGARILVARRNFGSGSSREAAVYALVDAGFRCVIAPSHGDIFSANAVNNGLLPARVSEDDAEAILSLLAPGGVRLALDLDTRRIEVGGRAFDFQIAPLWRLRLLNGWDEIDMTDRHATQIATWCETNRRQRPWAQLVAPASTPIAAPLRATDSPTGDTP